MNTDRNKVMQEALQAAVMRMNGSGSGGQPMGSDSAMPADPISMLMTFLPKLLQSNESNEEEREELNEKLEALKNEDIRTLRKQLHRVMKLQEQMLGELQHIREQQSAVGDAVLHLAEQMTRIEIISDLSDEPDGYEREVPPPSGDAGRRRASSDQARMRNKPAKR
jgi:hypothetical protein